MKKPRLFLYSLLWVAFCLALLAGCSASYRARLILDETREVVEEAKRYDAGKYAPDDLAVAVDNIHSSEEMLKESSPEQGLKIAREALRKAQEALDISLRSKAGDRLKEARAKLKALDVNEMGMDNPDVYDNVVKAVKSAESAYMGERFEESLNFSQDALFNGEIMLGGLRKEVSLRRDAMGTHLKAFILEKRDVTGLTTALGEIDEMVKRGEYRRALRGLEEAEKEYK